MAFDEYTPILLLMSTLKIPQTERQDGLKVFEATRTPAVLVGIVREECMRFEADVCQGYCISGFGGYAIGGLGVGEPGPLM